MSSDPVDSKKEYEKECEPKCSHPAKLYQDCVDRIKVDKTGVKHCTGQKFDFWRCIDKCAAPKIWEKLK